MWKTTTPERKRLKEIFDTSTVRGGVFDKLKNFTDIPWGNNNDLANYLDMAYLKNHSGNRYIAPILEIYDEYLTAAFLTTVLQSCYAIYKNKWTRDWEINNLEFNPIENYSMEEKHTGTDTDVDSPTAWTETETKTPTNWKNTEVQTPTNWKTSTEHKASLDYKESDTQTPTNWKTETEHTNDDYAETETKTPTDWKETKEYSFDQYSETDTDKPINWKKTNTALTADNGTNSTSKIYAFNASGAVPATEADSTLKSKNEESQTGTFERKKEYAGTRKEETETTGTFETKKEITGTQKDSTTQSGTFKTDHEQTGSLFDDTTQTGTYQTETTQSGTYQTQTTKSGTYQKQTTYNSTLKRSGNIGVTTSQQMAQSSIELWKWLYFEEVFKDLDKFLTLDTY